MATAQRFGAAFMGARDGLAALALSPLGALLWLAIVVRSAWRTQVRATLVWKGRALPVMDPPTGYQARASCELFPSCSTIARS